MSNAVGPIPALLLAGGPGGDPRAIIRIMKNALQSVGCHRVVYIGTANGDRRPFFEAMRLMIRQAGASSVELLPLAREKIRREAILRSLQAADAIFISGGEVEDGMSWLVRHDLLATLQSLHSQGKLFIGVSAGAIMIGSHWVRWEVPDDDTTASLFPCLNIVPAVFDTHAENEDWIELKTALRLMGDGSSGYGLPRGCIISADTQGSLTNLNEAYLTFQFRKNEFLVSSSKGE
ncbi:MAG: Type 1 glutamine amidotransferase-like domain-containing protein [Symbiobacteriaceae bacterium]|nr:Type 1 glutamine amidotransferase-like domain-containing protein [Symbiobacteriaceae bacterium]